MERTWQSMKIRSDFKVCLFRGQHIGYTLVVRSICRKIVRASTNTATIPLWEIEINVLPCYTLACEIVDKPKIGEDFICLQNHHGIDSFLFFWCYLCCFPLIACSENGASDDNTDGGDSGGNVIIDDAKINDSFVRRGQPNPCQ